MEYYRRGLIYYNSIASLLIVTRDTIVYGDTSMAAVIRDGENKSVMTTIRDGGKPCL